MADMSDLVSSLTKMELSAEKQSSKKLVGSKLHCQQTPRHLSLQRLVRKSPTALAAAKVERKRKHRRLHLLPLMKLKEAAEEKSPQSSAQEKETSPPSPKQKPMEEKKAPSPPPPEEKPTIKSPPTVQPVKEDDNDVLNFTSAAEAEAESSSAWEVVPEKKVARKIGVKIDSEFDHLVQKVILEAKSLPLHRSSHLFVDSRINHLPGRRHHSHHGRCCRRKRRAGRRRQG